MLVLNSRLDKSAGFYPMFLFGFSLLLLRLPLPQGPFSGSPVFLHKKQWLFQNVNFLFKVLLKIKISISVTTYGVLHGAMVCQPTESDQCYLDKWILYLSVIGQLCRPYWLLTVQPAKFESCNKYNIYLTKLVCRSVLCTYCKLRIPVLFFCFFLVFCSLCFGHKSTGKRRSASTYF